MAMTQEQFIRQLWDMAMLLNSGDVPDSEAVDRPDWVVSADVGTAGYLFKTIRAIGGDAFSDALHSHHEIDLAMPLLEARAVRQ
tara:strand:- start:100 stop:351 length:252 start_codon:yes stop_codon:yes gene_type:complete